MEDLRQLSLVVQAWLLLERALPVDDGLDFLEQQTVIVFNDGIALSLQVYGLALGFHAQVVRPVHPPSHSVALVLDLL